MDLSPETVEAKKRDLAEALAKRDNSARAVESLKEDLKTERGYLASLDSLIRSLSLEVATGKGLGDQLPLPGTASPPKASAAERTISLPLESNATPPPEAPASEESKADLATRNQIRSFVTSFDGQKVTFAQIVDAFPGHAADVLRAQLALLVEREEVFAQLAIGRRAGQRLEELAAERLALEALLLFQSPSGEAEPTTAPGDAKEGA